MVLTFDHTFHQQRILFGRDTAVSDTVRALEDLGAKRTLLIHGASATDLADSVAKQVSIAARIDDVVQHVPSDRADAATEIAEAQGVDAIVSIGGGSATGLAKIVALRRSIPIVAVPTTFSGSEATSVWGLTTDGRKETGSDSRVLPNTIVYDARLTSTLPQELVVTSGLNALAHAVDGLWAPNANPINQALGAEGTRHLIPGLRALATDPMDEEAREHALLGAYLAAVAFASAGSAMHHKICHVLGGAYNLPHAAMHAVVLPYVAEFNMAAAPHAEERVSEALGGGPAAAGLWNLRSELGAPPSLAAVGLEQSDIPEAATLILSAIPPSNPRPVTLEDITRILTAAWAGDTVTS